MQTNFTLAQLAQGDIQKADAILRNCVHCGMCLSTCPTYRLLGDERDSPRGRIYLIKNMLEDGSEPDSEIIRHLDRCLTCLACETVCPSHVDYRHLLDIGRAQINVQSSRPFLGRLGRWGLSWLLTNPHLLKPLLQIGGLCRFLSPIIPGLKNLPRPVRTAEKKAPTERPSKGRVLLLSGCLQGMLRPEINRAAANLLQELGFEVLESENECCGALAHHLGFSERADRQARKLEDIMERAGVNFILSTSSGCASVAKDRLAIEEIGGFLARFSDGLRRTTTLSHYKVGYHMPCSLHHGLGQGNIPRLLLEKVGFQLADIPDASQCCGSAGTYHLLEPAIARQLQQQKQKAVAEIAPDFVASANIGCLEQMRPILGLHYIELLYWAQSGEKPRSLAGIK